MFTPLRHTIPGLASISGSDSAQEVLILQREGQSVQISHDGFSIGSSSQCDLVLADASVSQLHCVVHIQSGAIWIEAACEEALILINDRPCRRMSLRSDDRIRIGAVEYSVRLQSKTDAIAEQATTTVEEDLSLLTAEELCDRIIAEHSLISEFDDGRRAGWDALLQAIEAAKDEVLEEELQQQSVTNEDLERVHIEELLEQIQELNETLTDRDLELTQREQEVLESTKILEETQREVTHRLDNVLDQLNQTDPPNELRASA